MNKEQKHSGSMLAAAHADDPINEQPGNRWGRRFSNRPGRRRFLLLMLALFMIAAILVIWQYPQARDLFLRSAASETGSSTPSAYKTTTVRRSDLSITITGTGTVITAKSADLGFLVSGVLSELYVEPGVVVTEGQVLAVLGNTAELKQTILDQQLAVTIAQKTLDDLLSGASSALAQAQAAQADAAQVYAEAEASVHYQGDARCSPAKTQEYYFQYLYAQKNVDIWEGYLNDPSTGYGRSYILENLRPLRQTRDQAYGNYTYCQGYTEREITDSQAALQLAKAKLDQANQEYENLQFNSGLDPAQVALAEAALENYRRQLSAAQAQLDGATIIAPMDGTVITVNAQVGDAVDAGTLITLADLEQPEVQIFMDEADLTNLAVGCPASVIFDSVPGEVFTGTVAQISPVMVTVNSSNMVEGLVELERNETASGKNLSVGMSASVEVTCSESNDAMTVPLQALYEPAGQSAYVYILNGQKQPEKREVMVGLRTVASAEITSGLSEGETVITSQIDGE